MTIQYTSTVHILVGLEVPATPHNTAASSGSPSRGNLSSPFASEKASSVASSCDSTSSSREPNSTLARVKTDLPSQVARLRRLSSSLTYTDLPATPQAEPVTPMGNTSSMSVFAPDTPNCFTAPVMRESSGQSSGGANATACDASADSDVRLDHGSPNVVGAESTLGRLQAVSGRAADADAEGEAISSVRSPLPDLPDCAHGSKGGRNSMRYVHIGCAVACLCVFALWARDASAASLSARMFPT